MLLARIKPARGSLPRNPSAISLLPFSLLARSDRERERSGAWRRRRPPRRRTRSPTGERAAVKGPSRGAVGQSPRKTDE